MLATLTISHRVAGARIIRSAMRRALGISLSDTGPFMASMNAMAFTSSA
jgi:hypothetical protein